MIAENRPNPLAEAPINEFPDRLSPMLVKELRQGLRTKGFIVAFLVIQGILALSVLAAQESGSSGNGSFFWILGLALVTVLPLRALAAFATEESRENLDLVRLTKLTTWRIVLGKWAALAAQSALFITTILPYVALRYFIGGVNPLLDLTWVFTLFLVGITYTGAALALSSIKNAIARLGSAAVIFITSIWALGLAYEMYYERGALPGHSLLAWILISVVITGALLFALLSASEALSSGIENYATPRRITVLVGLLALLVAARNSTGDAKYLILTMSAAVTAVGFLTAFSELSKSRSKWFSPISRGWRSALLFGFLCAAITAASFHPELRTTNGLTTFILTGGITATLLGPAAFALVTHRVFSNRISAYLCFCAATALALVAAVAFIDVSSIGEKTPLYAAIGSIFPPFIPIKAVDGMDNQENTYAIATAIHLSIIAGIATLSLRINKPKESAP